MDTALVILEEDAVPILERVESTSLPEASPKKLTRSSKKKTRSVGVKRKAVDDTAGNNEAPPNKKQRVVKKKLINKNDQLARAIKSNTPFELAPSFTRLDLTAKCIQSSGARLLSEALTASTANITEFSLADNFLPSKAISPILSWLRTQGTIEYLNLSGNKLTDTDAKLIWDFIDQNKSLTKVDLSNNRLTLAGDWVAGPLNTSMIAELRLNRNAIAEEGERNLAEALQGNNVLESLCVKNNHLRQCERLSEVLKTNKSLTLLDLSGNPVTSEGAQNLAQALETNSTLLELNLQETHIGLQGLTHLVSALSANTAVRHMRVAKNSYPSDVMKTFRHLLANRREMRQRTSTDEQSKREQEYTKITMNESDELVEREEEESSDSSVEVSGTRLGAHSVSDEESDHGASNNNVLNNDAQQVEGEEDIEVDIDATPASQLSEEESDEDSFMNGASTEPSQLSLDNLQEILADGDMHLHEKTTLYSALKDKLNEYSIKLEQRGEAIHSSIQKFERKIFPMRKNLLELEEERARLEKQIKPLKRQLQSLEIKYFKRVIEATVTQQKLVATRHNQKLISDRQATVNSEFDVWTQRLTEPLVDWTADDVVKLLSELKLEEYREQFLSNGITGAVLASLATTDLVHDLRMQWRHAKQLLLHVKLLQHGRSIYGQPAGVLAWTGTEVCQWLVAVGHGKHSKIFADKDITGAILAMMDKHDLANECKIESLGDRVAIDNQIKKLLDERRPFMNDHETQNEGPAKDQPIVEAAHAWPPEVICPLTNSVMTDPVVVADGYTYERAAIEAWLAAHDTSPVTHEVLLDKKVMPSIMLKKMIAKLRGDAIEK